MSPDDGERKIAVNIFVNPYPFLLACDQATAAIRNIKLHIAGEPDPFEDRSTWAVDS